MWWAGSYDSRNSALSRLLFARDGDGNVATSGAAVPSDAAATERFRELAGVSVEPAVPGPMVSWPGDVVASSRRSPRPRSTARSTGGGGARRSATSPPAPTSRTWRASRRRPSSTTSPRRTRRRSPTAGATALRAVPSLLADDAGRRRGRHARAPRVRVGRLRRRRLVLRARSRDRLCPGPAAGRARRHRRGGRRAAAPRSRRRWGRWPASPSGTSPVPTASTSSTSSSRWSAATTRAGRL